jgi:hypothetical protein
MLPKNYSKIYYLTRIRFAIINAALDPAFGPDWPQRALG